MSISESLSLFRPTTGTSSPLRPFERTPEFKKHQTLHLERDTRLVPSDERHLKRLKVLTRLNHPSAVAVIWVEDGRVSLDLIYHNAFPVRQMEGMLSLGVHMGEKGIADVSADLSIEKDAVKTFTDSIPAGAEVAFLVLDRNGLHRTGRQELIHEGLHLFCNRKEYL